MGWPTLHMNALLQPGWLAETETQERGRVKVRKGGAREGREDGERLRNLTKGREGRGGKKGLS